MKLNSIFLGFYFLLIAFVPCSDGNGGIVEYMNHLFNIENVDFVAHDHHDKSCEDDHCSPFCICSCCSMALEVPAEEGFSLNMPLGNDFDRPESIILFTFSSFATSIWEPPRFA
jgi:hypothetical protein